MANDPIQPEAPLRGRTIAVAESRELEVLAGLLERRGARILRYPLVTILDAPDPGPCSSGCGGLRPAAATISSC